MPSRMDGWKGEKSDEVKEEKGGRNRKVKKFILISYSEREREREMHCIVLFYWLPWSDLVALLSSSRMQWNGRNKREEIKCQIKRTFK
jgi:hypothetical protein